MTESSCTIAEGDFQGLDSTCEEASCVPVETGACCFAEGGCANYAHVVCDNISGAFQGVGTDCSTADCSTPTTGACCLLDGSCGVDSEVNCTASDGAYKGDGTDCTGNICDLIFGDGFETGDASAWSL